jgi:phage terminase large subunit GpA-like protein
MVQKQPSLHDIEHLSILAWLEANSMKTESGHAMDFHDHRYLLDIYTDETPYICSVKAGQICFSTLGIFKTIWLARNRHIDVGYILPTVEMVQKFVGSKVNRIAQQNPCIAKWFKDKDSISQKQIDENYIFYLGAQTDRSAIMLSLDMLVADEYDKAPQEILEIYDSRLQHSKFGYKWVFSNPTIPDFGVDTFWQRSDMKSWNVTHSCGKTFVLNEDCIDYKLEIYRCPHCREEITDEERRLGDWYNKDGVKWTGKIEAGYKWSG